MSFLRGISYQKSSQTGKCQPLVLGNCTNMHNIILRLMFYFASGKHVFVSQNLVEVNVYPLYCFRCAGFMNIYVCIHVHVYLK